MKTLNILHISDAHIQKKYESDLEEISKKLIADVIKVQNKEGINIDLVCFTGDIIQRGDNAISGENQMKIAKRILVKPLLERLNLDKSQFIIVPGNHEVDISKINKAIEKGLLVDSLDEINENVSDMNESYLERLEYFYDVINEEYDDVLRGKIGYAFNREINGRKVGIVCIDSSWRSSGKGSIEKGILYIGQKQIKDLYERVKNCDFKICIMHHPIDWLSEYETTLIERELTKFDVVLRGHVHENDTKGLCRQNMKTVYSTAGKLFPLDYAYGRAMDGYNGYSILNVNFDTNICTIYIRSYFAKDRGEFDCGINVVEGGKVEYALNGDTSDRQMEFDIVKGINEYFKHMSETFSMIKEIDSHSPMSLEQVFVEPILSEESEYVKESKGGKQQISVEELVYGTDNVVLFGKKETGKTSLLQKIGLSYIDRYNDTGVIPIHIDMRQLPKKKNKLANATLYFVVSNMFDDAVINKEKVRELISKGKFVFLIDNVDISDDNQTSMLKSFISENPNNRFFLTIKEEFFQSLDIKRIPEYGNNFRKVYIHYFGKAQIRQLVTRWAEKNDDIVDVNAVVEKIDGYCNQINFAKTPFNVSIFMVLWDNDKNFVPQNEGIVMQNYLEILLEKLSPDESDRNNYPFQIKQHFLCNLAYEMFKKDEYYLTETEFEDFVYNYHKQKGFIEEKSRFGKIFFEKGILSFSDGLIIFSHTSIMEYYLALYAKDNEDFLNYMLKKGNRTYFYNEICFYSGLVNDCKFLLDGMADSIIETILESIDIIENLNKMEIMAAFKMRKDELISSLNTNRPTQNELDKMSDKTYEKQEIAPTQISKKRSNIQIDAPTITNQELDSAEEIEEDTEDFYSLLTMYGCVLKNAELLDNTDKIIHLENYMYAMNILLGELLQVADKIRDEFTLEEYKKDLDLDEETPTEEEFTKIKEVVYDMAKISFPIAVQKMISENVGTPKLELAINELLLRKKDKPFEKFMFVFLKSDLKIGNVMSDLKRYIRVEESDSILKLILTKLVFYYRMRFFGVNKQMDNILLDLIVEIQLKLSPDNSKKLTQAIKGNKEIVRKKMAKQLEKDDVLNF